MTQQSEDFYYNNLTGDQKFWLRKMAGILLSNDMEDVRRFLAGLFCLWEEHKLSAAEIVRCLTIVRRDADECLLTIQNIYAKATDKEIEAYLFSDEQPPAENP